MANAYYGISPSTDTMLAIKNALEGKYGVGVTVHYQDSLNLIFSCGVLSNKVIKVTYSSSRLLMYYGDAWTSGTTITNQVQWAGYSNGACTYIDMILGDNTLLISSYQGTVILGTLFVIGKLTNDDYAVLSACGTANSGYYASFKGLNLSDSVDIYPVGFSGPFASVSGKLYKQILILNRSDNVVEVNGDGSFATFRDVFNCSHAIGNSVDLVGSNFILTSSDLYMANGKRLPTSMIAEF